jgi:hypothetical protein
MQALSMHDYVEAYFTLYKRFEQEQKSQGSHRGHPFDYATQSLILFFTIMMVRRINAFKAQWRWLKQHPEEARKLGMEEIPVRTTLSRRFKALYPTLQAFIALSGPVGGDAQSRI